MGLAAAIHSRLKNHAGTAALVVARIYPNQAPQDATRPYIVFERDATDHIEVLGGSGAIARATVTVSCWSDTYDEARSVAEQVRQALQGYQGTVESVVIDGVNLTGDADRYSPALSGEEIGSHYVEMDLGVWFVESVPA